MYLFVHVEMSTCAFRRSPSLSTVYLMVSLTMLRTKLLVGRGMVALFVTLSHAATSSDPHAACFVYQAFSSYSNDSLCLHLSSHWIKQLLSCRCCQRVVQSVVTRKAKLYGFNRINIQQEIYEEEAEPLLNQRMPRVTRFGHYHEPLLKKTSTHIFGEISILYSLICCSYLWLEHIYPCHILYSASDLCYSVSTSII